jgi:hypothetical protein
MTSLYTPQSGEFFLSFLNNNPLCKQSKNSLLCSVLFGAENCFNNVVFTLRHLGNQKGRCKKPVLRWAANSVWKPVNIIIKLYSEDVIFFTALTCQSQQFFLDFTLLHTDALTPSRTFYLQDLSGSSDVTSAINPWFSPPPLLLLWSVISIPSQYA